MRKILFVSVVLLVSAGLAPAAEWIGWIADQKCAEAGKAASDGHAGCAKKCIEAGEDAVLVDEKDGKVYELVYDEDVKIEDHAGKKVILSGELDEGIIEVESVKPAS